MDISIISPVERPVEGGPLFTARSGVRVPAKPPLRPRATRSSPREAWLMHLSLSSKVRDADGSDVMGIHPIGRE